MQFFTVVRAVLGLFQYGIKIIICILHKYFKQILCKAHALFSGRLLANPSELWYNLIELYSMAYCAGEKRERRSELGGITK